MSDRGLGELLGHEIPALDTQRGEQEALPTAITATNLPILRIFPFGARLVDLSVRRATRTAVRAASTGAQPQPARSPNPRAAAARVRAPQATGGPNARNGSGS